jgi:hypothetical protein
MKKKQMTIRAEKPLSVADVMALGTTNPGKKL